MLKLVKEDVNPEEIKNYILRFKEQMDRIPTSETVDIEDENDVSSAVHNWLVELEHLLNKYL